MGNRPVSNAPVALEAQDTPTPVGQGKADAYMKEKWAEGTDPAYTGLPQSITLGAALDERPIVTRQGMRENFAPGTGIDTVAPHVIKDLGINPDTEVWKWTHQNNYLDMGEKNLDDWLADNPSGRIPMDPDGKPYVRRGEVLVCIPKVVDQSIKEDYNRPLPGLQQGDDGPFDAQNAGLTEDEMRARRAEHEEALRDMLSNSPTNGRQLEEVFGEKGRLYSDKDLERTWDKLRWQGRTVRQSDQENAVDRMVETGKAASRGRSGLHSMGAGFDKNGKIVR